jgi:uncharacterized protein with HEPN domain
MPKDDHVYLQHMLETAQKIRAKVTRIDRATFDADENLRLALVHLIQRIGEAARRVAPQTQVRYPDIPWREIIGMRHKIVHDYLNVDEDVVWAVVTGDIPPLAEALARLLPVDEEDAT